MTPPSRSAVVHAHFYQPPREDPWLEEVPREASAAPFHDWNARIERECYRAVVAARVPGPEGRIADVVNTLEHVSFDAGPTLLSWLARAAPDTYRRFLQADRLSCERLDGHGNAVAAPYHHVILPLADRRDKETEVRWGLADFRHRFQRDPEGCWLPETAVDEETLDVLAACGVRFTILAPHQVESPPADGTPVRYTSAAGHTLALIVYDGGLSHDVAFGPLVRDGHGWATAMRAAHKRLVTVATDGETYGHHHEFGEMALAAMLADLRRSGDRTVESPGAFLARHPARAEAVLVPRTSWSCAHGVERWRADCGCRLEPETWPSQAWRAPLRDGLTGLQARLHALFGDEGGTIFRDPWAARDAYGTVVCGATPLEEFLDAWVPDGTPPARLRAGALLEMERHALGMMTSCGWFFDDVSGLESLQVLRYAARAIELAGPEGASFEAELRERLAESHSNDPAAGSARDLFDTMARPRTGAATVVAAAVAALRAVGGDPRGTIPDHFDATGGDDGLTIRHRRTGEEHHVSIGVTRPGPGRIALTDGAGADIPPSALPDRARSALAERLRREVLDLWLSDEEAAALCGGAPLTEVAGQALLRAVLQLEADSSPMNLAQVLDLADLHHLLERPIPFDVQTAFADVRARLDEAASDRVSAIARRLGFA